MSDAPQAVFLSYAREDADAARRIADALRSQGVEVWLDQSELRGGDAWDAKIRRQIRECALFVPVISAHTQERGEGYFRLEWKLAVERTHLMAEGVPFLAPVVVDDTPDSGAVVPAEFMRVQWTRLPGALPTPPFVSQVKRLLSRERRAGSGELEAGRPRPAIATRGEVAAAPKTLAIPGWMWAVLAAVLVIVAAGIVVLRKPEPTAAPAAKSPSLSPSLSPPAAAADKSIAVLPFENMSADKENAFFADGVHEDILTNLGQIAELKVISRTSVMEYRGTTKKIQQIASELGVAYVLEGSVRRAGNKVRVVCQLIDGRTGQHVLAPDPYDRDLADIFAIQSELAKNIAEKLQAVLSPREKAALERPPTENLAAYDLFLKARQLGERESNRQLRVSQRQPLYEGAVRLDPNFALAWVGLAGTHLEAFNYLDRTTVEAAKAKEAIDRALALAPDNESVVATLGNYYIDVRDFPRAAEVVERLKRDFPNQARTFGMRARLAYRLGQPAEGLACYREAVKLDPRNSTAWESLQSSLWGGRRYDEAAACARKVLELVPDNLVRAFTRALIAFDATGSAAEVEKLLASLTPEVRRNDPTAIAIVGAWARICGDADEVIRSSGEIGNPGPAWGGVRALAEACLAKGQTDRARPILEQECTRLQGLLEKEPDNADNWALLAYARAMLGDRAGALSARQKAMADPLISRGFSDSYFHAWLGNKDEALSALARAIETGIGASTTAAPLSVHRLRHGLYLWPLVGDPRFEALLNDPKNNAPLF